MSITKITRLPARTKQRTVTVNRSGVENNPTTVLPKVTAAPKAKAAPVKAVNTTTNTTTAKAEENVTEGSTTASEKAEPSLTEGNKTTTTRRNRKKVPQSSENVKENG